jgi:type IX secretion system PorP/SprF family membrane protein
MKKIGLSFLCISLSWQITAQQLPQYTQTPFHQFNQNPALAGIEPCLNVHILYRKQWWGVPQSPSGGFITLSGQLGSKKRKYMPVKHGLGLKIETDAIGPFVSNRANFAYAAHFPLTKNLLLSFGAYAGLNNISFDASKVKSYSADPTVQNSKVSYLAPDASFGVFLNNDHFFGGITAQQLIPIKYGFGKDARMRMHFVLNGGGKISIGKQVSFLPSILAQIPPKGPMSINLYALFDFNNFITAGLGYRSQESLMFLIRVKFLGYLSLAYSFDFMLNPLRGAGVIHTHEFSLVFSTCKKKSKNPNNCPVFE